MHTRKIEELSNLIESFLERNSNVSINALAMRMGVAETTLRRIRGGQIKRLPNSENLLKIVFYIFKTKDLYEIKELLPLHLKEHFTSLFLLTESSINNPVVEIDDNIIDNQTTYLVLKLASNYSGVKKDEVLRLFGERGLNSVEQLMNADILTEERELFKTKVNAFRLPHNSFIKNFKSVSDFIKIDPAKTKGPNLYYNLSESINLEGLTRVQSIQMKAVKEISEILNNDKFKGNLPVFSLTAIDTLD